jgi:hypothetical protein
MAIITMQDPFQLPITFFVAKRAFEIVEGNFFPGSDEIKKEIADNITKEMGEF